MKHLLLTESISVCEISFFRSTISLIFAVPLVLAFKKSLVVERDLILPLLNRCLCGVVAFIMLTKIVSMIPLTINQVIINLVPFVAGLIAFLWLGEKLAVFQIVAMFFCFAGMAIVALSNNAMDESSEVTDDKSEFSQYKIGVVLAIFCMIIIAISNVATRRIRNLHFSVIQFYLAVLGFIVGGVWLLIFSLDHEVFQFHGGVMTWIMLLILSFCYVGASYSTTCMNQSMNPATVGMFMQINIFYSYLADVLIFDSHLSPLQFLGGGIILSFTVAATLHKRYATPPEEEGTKID